MKTLALVTITLSIGGLLFGCAAIERAMPRTLSDANLMSVLLTIDVHEIAVAKLAIEKASSDPVHAYATQLVDAHSVMLAKHLHVANRIKPDKPNLASALNILIKTQWKHCAQCQERTLIVPFLPTR